MGFFVHAQAVDTRPRFPPPTWPGYETNLRDTTVLSTLCNKVVYKTRDGIIVSLWYSHLCYIAIVHVQVQVLVFSLPPVTENMTSTFYVTTG